MDYTEEILKVLSTELEPFVSPTGEVCIDGVLTSAHKLNELFQQKLKQCDVSGWVAFEDAKPKAMQEIWIVWPSGAFNPEFRQLTEDDLKQDWSGMKWCPVPPYR